MAAIITNAQITQGYTANTQIYDTSSANQHINLAAKTLVQHPASTDYLQLAQNKKEMRFKSADTIKAKNPKVPQKKPQANAKKDTSSVEEIINEPKVLYKATGKEARYFTKKGEKVSYVEILTNGNVAGYDSKDNEVFNRSGSRRDQCTYRRLIKNIEPKYNEVVDVPQKHAKHFTKNKKAKSVKIVDGVLLRTYNKKNKLIEQGILTPEKLENYREHAIGDTMEMDIDVPEGVKVKYSDLLDSTGRKILGPEDVGFYKIDVKASADGFKTVAGSVTYYIAVKGSNFAPERIDTIRTITVLEGDSVEVKPEFVDKDGDTVKVGVKGKLPKWLYFKNGKLTGTPTHSTVSKGTLYVKVEGSATDGKDETHYSITVGGIDKNLEAKIVGLDSVNKFGVMEGDTLRKYFYFVDADSAEAKAKGSKIMYPKDTTKQEPKAEAKKDTSFDTFIDSLLNEDKTEKKEEIPTLEELADPSKYTMLVKRDGKDKKGNYELRIIPPKNAVSEKDSVKELELIIMYDDGKEDYQVAVVNLSIYNKPEKEDIGKDISLKLKTKEQRAKEAENERKKEERKVKREERRKERKASLYKADGSYDTSKGFDLADYMIAGEFVKKFARHYKNGEILQILKELKTVEPLLAKKSKSSHYKNLKRIYGEMQKFTGYDTVAANLFRIHNLTKKKEKMRVCDYRKANNLIDKTWRTVKNNKLDENPKCEGLIGDLNLQKRIVKGKKPGKLRQVGYSIVSLKDIVNPNEWRNHPKETSIKLSAVGGAVAVGVVSYNTISDIRAERRFEQGLQNERNIAANNPNGVSSDVGGASGSFTDSDGNSNINPVETDSTSSDKLDSLQNFKVRAKRAARAVKFSNEEAAIRNGMPVADYDMKSFRESFNVDVPRLIKNKEFRMQFIYRF